MPKQYAFNQPSVMEPQHRFSMVPRADIPRSRFDRSHGYKTTFNAGLLIPIYVDEVLPGDTFSMNPTLFARMTTPLFPIMDNIYLDCFFFAVPYRLLWDNWEKFCGAQTNPGDSTDFLIPVISGGPFTPVANSIYDYFGIPVGVDLNGSSSHPSALPFRAYNLIYNEWFRDQNMINSLTVATGDGPDSSANYALQRRGKRHDYFTSCLPFPQKGDAVTLPLGTSAPITFGADGTAAFRLDINDNTGSPRRIDAAQPTLQTLVTAGDAANVMYADLSTATAATINQIRESFQIQRLLERDARSGTRYTEVVLAHFGVSSPDARLQRPEFLGGASVPVNISPMAAATENTDRNLGDLAGVGIAINSGGNWSKSFTEHCVLIGLCSVRADLTYQQGMDRMWNRSTRYDFYWPVLAHLGEQAVLNKEIMTQGVAADNSVFGYQERWAEYRYKPSKITAGFRSSAVGSLDVWHLSQDFATLPALNKAFIEENPPMDRILAVPTEPDFLLDCWFDLKCARPMPVYSVPGLIDHF